MVSTKLQIPTPTNIARAIAAKETEKAAPTKTEPAEKHVGDTWGDDTNKDGVAKKEPALPSGKLQAPTHYEAGPSIDEVAAGSSLELGHKGPAVNMLQQALNKLGADPALAEDGMLGPKTFAALKAFQEKNGVNPGEHGCVGPATLEALASQLTPEDIDRMRDRAVAAYAISQGQIECLGKKNSRDITNQDIDDAMGETEWTPEMQANVGNFKPMSQSNSNAQLGNGSSTIRGAGCMLAAYAMASSGLTGNQSLTPKSANDIVKSRGGFSGSSLNGPVAAAALNMKQVSRSHGAGMKNKIDDALAKGQAVVLGVDYKAGSKGSSSGTGVDHWVTVTGKDAAGNYIAIDPVGGRTFSLTPELTGRGWASGTRYVGKEAIVLDKA